MVMIENSVHNDYKLMVIIIYRYIIIYLYWYVYIKIGFVVLEARFATMWFWVQSYCPVTWARVFHYSHRLTLVDRFVWSNTKSCKLQEQRVDWCVGLIIKITFAFTIACKVHASSFRVIIVLIFSNQNFLLLFIYITLLFKNNSICMFLRD